MNWLIFGEDIYLRKLVCLESGTEISVAAIKAVSEKPGEDIERFVLRINNKEVIPISDAYSVPGETAAAYEVAKEQAKKAFNNLAKHLKGKDGEHIINYK